MIRVKGDDQECQILHVNDFRGRPAFISFDEKSFITKKSGEMKKYIHWFNNPPVTGQPSILILRLMAGGVFLWEGILKFVYPNQGMGRFTKLGFPAPELTAHFVASAEIIGGLFLIFGIFTRFAAFFFVIEMVVAILSTKITLYLGTSPLPLPPAPPKIGIWAVLHEIRPEYAQIMVCLFMLIEGPGSSSADHRRWIKNAKNPE